MIRNRFAMLIFLSSSSNSTSSSTASSASIGAPVSAANDTVKAIQAMA